MNSNAQTISRIKKLIDSISPSTRLAVWGTGNHTSRLLGATSLAEKNIIKFYDSDNKKYNYRVLGKKVEKFERYDIESGAVEAILISAYAAQDAIKAAIEKANVDVEIITLY
ncbi:hypothetical protein FACS1894199_16580 [Bacteroidia bacterium]|nr:hypothetical protein FACS1894199_16580 [Bacteroidia bacterium]